MMLRAEMQGLGCVDPPARLASLSLGVEKGSRPGWFELVKAGRRVAEDVEFGEEHWIGLQS